MQHDIEDTFLLVPRKLLAMHLSEEVSFLAHLNQAAQFHKKKK
jgi:hypothetical protein